VDTLVRGGRATALLEAPPGRVEISPCVTPGGRRRSCAVAVGPANRLEGPGRGGDARRAAWSGKNWSRTETFPPAEKDSGLQINPGCPAGATDPGAVNLGRHCGGNRVRRKNAWVPLSYRYWGLVRQAPLTPFIDHRRRTRGPRYVSRLARVQSGWVGSSRGKQGSGRAGASWAVGQVFPGRRPALATGN